MSTEEAAERKALEREFKWLLDQEYHPRIEAISSKLKECDKKFKEAFSSGDPLRPILLQSDIALCTAAIEGDKVVKAEINVKSGRGSRPIRTSIKEHQPWKLKQIQDAANYLGKACKWLDKVKGKGKPIVESTAPSTGEGQKDNGGGDPDSDAGRDVEGTWQREPAEIRKSLEELTRSLRKAESSLLLPQPVSAKQIYSTEQKSSLYPALPEDIALNFHICSATLVLTILTITQINKSHMLNRNIPNQGLGTYWMGCTFEHGHNLYEVTHQIQTSSIIPWLSTVLTLVQATLELAQDFIDKVQIFETMGLTFHS